MAPVTGHGDREGATRRNQACRDPRQHGRRHRSGTAGIQSLAEQLKAANERTEQLITERDEARAEATEAKRDQDLYADLVGKLKREDLRVTVVERDQLVRDVYWLSRAVREGLGVIPVDVSADVQRRVAPVLAKEATDGAESLEQWLERLAPHALTFAEIREHLDRWLPPSLPAHERIQKESLLRQACRSLEATLAAMAPLPPDTGRDEFETALGLLRRSPPIVLRHA